VADTSQSNQTEALMVQAQLWTEAEDQLNGGFEKPFPPERIVQCKEYYRAT
jgi:hypothetical protein